VNTTRLFKTVLDGSCIWTSLRPSEGFNHEKTLHELKKMYPDDPDEMEEGNGIPEAIKDMMGNKDAMEALGAMIWWVMTFWLAKCRIERRNLKVSAPTEH
jgi:DNA mismatch repair protein MSH6